MIKVLIGKIKMMWRQEFLRYIFLFFIFLTIIAFWHYKLNKALQINYQKIQDLQIAQKESQDFLMNKQNYIFESIVKVNQSILEFITQSIESQHDAHVLYLKKKEIRRLDFFQSYLPVRSMEFDIGLHCRFMTILFLAEQLKNSPFLIIWKNFSFNIDQYPEGDARLVFYTFFKKE